MFNKLKQTVGISPLTWSNDDLPELGGDIPFAQSIAEMAQAGFLGTEVGSQFPKSSMAIKSALAPHGLKIAGAWFSSYFTHDAKADETIRRFKLHAAFLRDLDAHVINICECGGAIQQKNLSIFGSKPLLTERDWGLLARGLEAVGEIAASFRLKLVYHPHMGTVIQNAEEIDRLMAITEEKHVHLLLDTGHAVFAGDDPYLILKTHRARIKHVHLKDLRSEVLLHSKNQQLSFLQAVKAGVFTVPGDGVIDFRPIFQKLSESDYEGWLMVEAEQDPKIAHPLSYALKARNYLREHTGL